MDRELIPEYTRSPESSIPLAVRNVDLKMPSLKIAALLLLSALAFSACSRIPTAPAFKVASRNLVAHR